MLQFRVSKVWSRSLLLILLPTFLSLGQACTIFVTQGNGNVWVGNNEDDTPGRITYLWFKPNPSIGYVLWGHREDTPEGGTNDRGLFFDAAALPDAVPIRKHADRLDLNAYAVEPVLSQCGTVADALRFLGRLNLNWQEKAQIFLADKTGDSAVVHANWIIRKGVKSSFVLTNHRLDTPNPAVCWRRGLADAALTSKRPRTLALVRNILEETAQRDLSNETLYSDAIDLTSGDLTIYNGRRFRDPITFNLRDQLQKGTRTVELSSLFPTTLKQRIERLGLDRTIQDREADGRLDPEEIAKTGYKFLRSNRSNEAIRLFQLAVHRFRSSKSLSDLGNALQFLHRFSEARIYYRRALILNAKDYSANLMGRNGGRVIFRLPRFKFANKVEVQGSFGKHPLELIRKNDEWFGQIKLAPGNYTYAFHVDDTWTTDPDNGLARKAGKWWASLISVQ